MLWSGDTAWKQSGERRMLCGLQLPGPATSRLAFKGKVADLDQSKVWPAGTCLGIDPSTNQPNDVPVDCSAPHAMEVTGAVNLAEKFPGGLPADPDQDAFIKDVCTRMTDAYLAPVQLRTTTLTLIYSTVSLPSWTAGSHQVSCSIGATLGNGGWATLINRAKGPLLINGHAPGAPARHPRGAAEHAALPLLPDSSSTTYSPSTTNNSQYSGSQQQQQTQQTQTQQTLTQQPTAAAGGADALSRRHPRRPRHRRPCPRRRRRLHRRPHPTTRHRRWKVATRRRHRPPEHPPDPSSL